MSKCNTSGCGRSDCVANKNMWPQKEQRSVKPLVPFLELRHSFFVAMFYFLFVFAWTEKSSAQTVQVDRAQLLQSQTQPPFAQGVSPEGVQGGRAAASPNDADLGEQEILKRVERYQPFTASLSLPLFYTSNVALTRSGEVSDLVTAPVAAFYYQPRITK